MCAEEYGPVLLVLNEEVPGCSPGIGIHTRGWLIQHHKLGSTNQSHAYTAATETQYSLSTVIIEMKHSDIISLAGQTLAHTERVWGHLHSMQSLLEKIQHEMSYISGF